MSRCSARYPAKSFKKTVATSAAYGKAKGDTIAERNVHVCLRRRRAGHVLEKVFRRKESSADEYYIFRSRTRADGGISESHYGRIWGLIDYGSEPKDTVSGSMNFHYYFNPTPNDRTLEFDGKSNLFYPDWKDYDWPKDP